MHVHDYPEIDVKNSLLCAMSSWSWNEVLANSMERAEREGLTDGVARAKGG